MPFILLPDQEAAWLNGELVNVEEKLSMSAEPKTRMGKNKKIKKYHDDK